MRLSVFILENLEDITQEWETFAEAYIQEAKSLDKAEMRDHLTELLKTIAIDLSCPRTAQEELEKSKDPHPQPNQQSVAAIHGFSRWLSGFSLSSVVAEYRALRSSVIRLWQNQKLHQPTNQEHCEDMIRFNEAIDQAIT
jgi:RsbT co-antagonist protein rsbRD N-terminal domain